MNIGTYRSSEKRSVIFSPTNWILCDPDNFAGQWRKTRDELGVPDISSHSFRKIVATLIDDVGLSVRIGADHVGNAKVSMTQDRYMSCGRVHNQVAELLDEAVKCNSSPLQAMNKRRLALLSRARYSI